MARYNEILSGRYNRFLAKHLSMKGEAPAPQLSTEIMPVLNLPWEISSRFLLGLQMWALNFSLGAVAAQSAFFQLANPKGSNVIVEITKIRARSTPATNGSPSLALGQPIVTQGSNQQAVRLDGRVQPGSGSSVTVSVGNAANPPAGLATIDLANLVAPGNLDFILTDDQRLIVSPGDALVFYEVALNQAFNGTVWWTERPLEPSELSF